MEKILTIAGSDCSGGAGIQADLKTFAANGTYGMSVITAITVQNTLGVTDVQDIEPKIVAGQIDAVFNDIRPDAVKVGMVSNEEIINIIADRLKKFDAKNVVIDPVMISTSGSSLMDPKAETALIENLLPLADMITPNMSESSVLSKIEVVDKKSMEEAAKIIGKTMKGIVLIKGGHLEKEADDLLYVEGSFHWVEGRRIDNENTHGTGCTLSSAIAVYLAKGLSPIDAFVEAKKYLTGAIEDQFNIGSGHGPLNHIYNIKKA